MPRRPNEQPYNRVSTYYRRENRSRVAQARTSPQWRDYTRTDYPRVSYSRADYSYRDRYAADAARGRQRGSSSQSSRRGGSRSSAGRSSATRRFSGWIPLFAVVFIVIVAYGIGVGVFSRVFYPNTTIDGTDVSLKSVDEVAKEHCSGIENHVLAVTIDTNKVGEVLGSDIGLTLDGEAYAQNALVRQNPWLWPFVAWTISHKITVADEATFDQTSYDTTISSLVKTYNATASVATDAKIGYDSTEKAYEIIPEVGGTQVDEELVSQEVEPALVVLASKVELTQDCYLQPAVLSTDENLQEIVSDVNGSLDATQSLTVNDEEVAEVTSEQIGEWVSVADDLSVVVDEEAITTWTQGDLSRELDTVGTTRTYSTPDGATHTVSGGYYGWNINGAELAESIAKAIKKGESGTIEIPMKQAAEVWAHGTADWGNRWVEVDLSDQHATFYDDGDVIWESDFVSGNATEGYGTPTGVYYINSYKTSTEDAGERVKLISPYTDSSGNPTYISYVDYWMPFIDNLVAFHDADWRSEFGGTIYQTDGSHGCVNLPVDKAIELYDIIEVGDVVVVHD